MITVAGRKLVIPEKDSQIGTTYDNNSEVRYIRVNRITAGGVDLSNLSFKLDLEYEDAILDTCLLDSEVQETYILLTWRIPAACVAHKGTVWMAVRAYDESGTIKWATNPGAVYVEHTIFNGDAYNGHLAEFEQMEERITQKMKTMDSNESERQEAEEQRKTSESERQEAEEQRKTSEERRVNNEAEWKRQAETAIIEANTTLKKATQKAEEATQAAVDHANAITTQYKQYADEKLVETERERQAAEQAKQSADDAAILSQSWAIGGTGSRHGEDGNNSKYYSDQSKADADRAKNEADRAAQYASIIPPTFHIDFDTMELIQDSQGGGITFTLDENKVLSFEYMA